MSAEPPRKQRLSRLDVIFIDAPIYFLTACTDKRRKLLADPAVHAALIRFAEGGPVKNSLSKTLRVCKISSPHWQKTFFDHVLRNSESYAEKWNYVLENPARAGLVDRAEGWPFQGEIFQLD